MRNVTIALLFATFGTGCTPIAAVLLGAELLDGDGDPGDDGDWAWTESGDASSAPIEGRMRGQLGEVSGIDGEIRDSYLSWYGDYASLDLHTLDSDWAMINGGFDVAALSDGETVALEPGEHWLIGCSGPDMWVADYDAPAEEVTVFTEVVTIDGEEVRIVEINATFEDGSEVSAEVIQPTADPDAE